MPQRRLRQNAWSTVVVMCVLVQCCSLFLPWPAWGADDGASSAALGWNAPRECPDSARVEARLRELAPDWRARRGQRTIHGAIRRDGRAGWTLSLDIASSDGSVSRRLLTAHECDELADAAAVAITIALGDISAAPGDESPPATVTALDASTAPAASDRTLNAGVESPSIEDEAASVVDESGPRRTGVGVGASLVADSGTLSGVALGASLLVRARWESWNFGAYGVWLPGHVELVAPGQGVEFSLLAGGGRACRAVSESPVEVAACLGFEVGAVRAASHGLVSGRDRRDTWLAPVLGLELGWRPLERLAVSSRLEAAVPLAREAYVVDGDELVHVTPDVALRWSLGIEADVISSR